MTAFIDVPAYKSIEEKLDDERRYLSEFDIISWKLATKMSDLTEELKLCHKWLNFDEDTQDIFDDENGVESVQVRVWSWTRLVDGKEKIDHLLDMNTWPKNREGESGSIFLNGQLVILNSDDELHWSLQAPLELILRMSSLNHLRHYHCENDDRYDDEPEAHQHCKRVARRLAELESN